MPQSLSKVYIHYVFSTKYREPVITKEVQEELHKYIIGILAAQGSFTYAIYANPDHIHILCTLPRTITIATLISKTKSASSKWLKSKGVLGFTWQRGYGAFSVSESGVIPVESYINNQEAHHAKQDFKKEYIGFLKKYKLDYDEKYVWD